MAVGGGVFTVISRCFSDSVHLDVDSWLSVFFLGALDGQQLLVVKGSRCTISIKWMVPPCDRSSQTVPVNLGVSHGTAGAACRGPMMVGRRAHANWFVG